jgi:membrane protein
VGLRKLVERAGTSLPVRCAVRFLAINGRDRAFVIAGQAFTTVIPLLIIIGAAARHNGTAFVADRLNSRFNLTGPSAEALRTLFERPPGATGTITVASAIVLLPSLVSLTRALQRAFEDAWSLPPVGVRGTLHGLTGFGFLLACVLVLSLLASAMRPWPAGAAVATVVRTLAAIGMWLLLQDLLLSRRIAIRRLVPGAIVAGIGQILVSLGSDIWMPRLVAQNAGRYGVIGVTFALLSWLIVVGVAIVLLAATCAELGGADRPGRPPGSPGARRAGLLDRLVSPKSSRADG